ncbi:MAG: glycosyltransferase family 4 protein [Candidatus Latescibacterota bacterium]
MIALSSRHGRCPVHAPPTREPAIAQPPVRILFLARRYPPCIGGIETHCYELYRRLCRCRPVRLVALRRQSLLHLAWFLPYCLGLTFLLLLCRRTDVVYFSDGVVGALAPLLRPFARGARFVVTIYGLEMTYRNRLAQARMVGGANACELVVVISRNTREITARQGIPEERMTTIHLGVEPTTLAPEQEAELAARFEAQHGITFGRDRVLLNFGRQVQRKGVAAFLEHGLPLLDPDIRLLVGGRGPEIPRIAALRERLGLQERVLLLGPVPDDLLAMLRHRADLFLMPNVPMETDVEGFGQTQLECMHAGTPVVAFAVDALTESVREGGYLVPSGEYRAFVDRVHRYYALSPAEREAKREEARAYVQREYSWDRTTDRYVEVFEGKG